MGEVNLFHVVASKRIDEYIGNLMKKGTVHPKITGKCLLQALRRFFWFYRNVSVDGKTIFGCDAVTFFTKDGDIGMAMQNSNGTFQIEKEEAEHFIEIASLLHGEQFLNGKSVVYLAENVLKEEMS